MLYETVGGEENEGFALAPADVSMAGKKPIAGGAILEIAPLAAPTKTLY